MLTVDPASRRCCNPSRNRGATTAKISTKSPENAAGFLQRAAEKSLENNGNEVQWEAVFNGALQQFSQEYDPKWGGFGDAPKFPRPVTHDFLHRAHAAIGEPNAIEMSRHTLNVMCRGGMRDHLGGGFHRYSVDSEWVVSHFEKMLYDQAQLTVSLLEIGQISGDPYFHDMARSTPRLCVARFDAPKRRLFRW